MLLNPPSPSTKPLQFSFDRRLIYYSLFTVRTVAVGAAPARRANTAPPLSGLLQCRLSPLLPTLPVSTRPREPHQGLATQAKQAATPHHTDLSSRATLSNREPTTRRTLPKGPATIQTPTTITRTGGDIPVITRAGATTTTIKCELHPVV